ncbi:TonB-dependent receptor [Pontibacter diazotrophicus]|uniref:TonB-dependent receptor n=2 Tax=Pontibacter diazotrophicus TaxID=1400979 RepID=A0A3D8LEV0_9BACT|nr:TonB-dependent receptor [Pontibacter diazotrophicus]
MLIALLSTWQMQSQAQVLAFEPRTQEAPKASTIKVRDALNNFRGHYKVDILFSDQVVKEYAVPANTINLNQPLEHNLENILKPTGLEFKKSKDGTYLIKPAVKNEKHTQAPPQIRTSTLDAEIVERQTGRSIKGEVTDESGVGLPGVTVIVKGTTIGTATGVDGTFSLNLPTGNETLVVSYIGFKTQEIAVGDKTVVNVSLQTDAKALEEVVVVGYGVQKKSDITGSVGSVKSEELTSYPVPDAVMGLQGKTAGVQVVQNSGAPGATVSVRVRGGNSLQGGNEPLYVVDGFALTGAPNSLSPNDIESLEVLKDASATAIYGSRGANGVVLITTKRGKAGKAQIDFSSYYAIQEVGKTLDLMNAREFAELANERAVNDGVPLFFTQDQINALGEGTDWQDELFRKAPMQNHSLTVSGGSENSQYSVSGSYLSQDGIIVGSSLERQTLRANLNQTISPKIKLNVNTILSNTDNSQLNSDNGQKGNSVLSAVLGAPPTVTPKDADGFYSNIRPYSFSPNSLENPLALALERKQDVNQKSILAGTALTYEPIERLIFKTSVGVESNSYRTDIFSPSIIFATPKSQASIGSTDIMNILNENTVAYSKQLKEDHDVSLLGGVTYQQNTFKTFNTGNTTGFSTDELGANNLGAGSVPGFATSATEKWVLFSYLGRVNYSYKSTYLLTASMRADGSSRFGNGNKWGYFPSAAFAWRAINEDFAKDLTYLSDLKFRLSYGITGNSALSPYQTLNTLYAYRTVYNDQNYIGYAPSLTMLANSNLKWETTAQYNAGMDVAFWNNRLSFTMDYYRKDTRDLLVNVPLPTSSGYTTSIMNIGKVRNTGTELGLNAIIVDNESFKWDMNLNVSKNKSLVVQLDKDSDVYGVVLPQPVSASVNLVRVGLPVGVFYGYMEDGLNENGDIRYKDLNGDGTINNNDKAVIGDPNPDFLYNFGSSMSYKSFELTYLFQGKQGGDLFNMNLASQGSSFYFGENQLKDVYENYWSASNPDPNAKYPKISANAKFRESDRFVEDGSFLRLRNIQLAYNLPVSKTSIKWMQGFQIYASAQNLLTFTNYSWYDPEVNTRGGSNSVSMGIDNSGYPNAKTYTLGVRVKL